MLHKIQIGSQNKIKFVTHLDINKSFDLIWNDSVDN